MDSEIGDLFVCEDYVLEEFQFNGILSLVSFT